MSIEHRVLGSPGRDNALFVRILTGQSVHRLLFDCGQSCLDGVGLSEIQAIDHIFFSHFHIDHISGFDAFFRATYNRRARPNVAWGPPDATRVLHARFQGFTWNLQAGLPGRWHVHAIHEGHVERTYAELGESFARVHDAGRVPFQVTILDEPAYSVTAVRLDHRTPSLGYVVREKSRLNVDPARLASAGLEPGPWIQAIKSPASPDEAPLVIGGKSFNAAELRRQLLVESPGDSIAYLTDFLMTESAREKLTAQLAGCTVIVCESQYRPGDRDLARKNYHLTCTQAAELARDAGAGKLILFHVSDRYTPEEWKELLSEARAVFAQTHFPDHWAELPGSNH